MTDLLITLLIPLFSAIFCILLWKKNDSQKVILLLGAGLTFFFSARLVYSVLNDSIVSVQMGQWAAPFGITLIADLLSAGIICITAFTTFMVAIYSLHTMDAHRKNFGFFPVLLFLLFGVIGALLAGDIFNLYVWFEIIMVSTFVLLTLGGTQEQLEGSIKYVVINFLASSILLAGIGILYGLTGTLNMADLALKIPEISQPQLSNLAAGFFIIGFGIKAAVFPLYFWLPASYPTPPIAITAMVGGLLTKIGGYVLIRYFTLVFTNDIAFTHTILLYIAGLTMVVGALGAIAQNDFHKTLSFSIVSQIGYIIFGLALYTPLALAGAIFFLFHNILVKTNLFLISGVVYGANASYKLQDLGGVYKRLPLIAALFLISAFALTGLPPLTGFWGKFLLAKAGLESGEYLLVFVAIGSGLLTLFYMTKIWNEAFWKKDPHVEQTKDNFPTQLHFLKSKILMVAPVALICIVVLGIGCFPQFFIDYSLSAAEQIMSREAYINAVLNR